MDVLRVVFMGTAELSCSGLKALIGAPFLQVIAVVTQPDKPKGRELKLQPSPVKRLALEEHLPVLQPNRARNDDFIQELRSSRPELIVVAAYGQILPPAILDLPRFGCINVHTSLLPKYRGAAPIQWAILNGEKETGITIMKMDPGLDTGNILTQQSTSIQPEDNGETLHDRLAKMGADLLVRTIPDYVTGKISPQPQPSEGASYAPKIRKEDGHIDWTQPAGMIWNRLRGLTPWPGVFTFLPAQPRPQLIKVWQAEAGQESGAPGNVLLADKSGIVVGCGSGSLRILVLQKEGGKRLSAQEFLTGHPLKPGTQLG